MRMKEYMQPFDGNQPRLTASEKTKAANTFKKGINEIISQFPIKRIVSSDPVTEAFERFKEATPIFRLIAETTEGKTTDVYVVSLDKKKGISEAEVRMDEPGIPAFIGETHRYTDHGAEVRRIDKPSITER